MIAIYVRQSIDKKDSISIETQIELCKKEIVNNEEYIVFKDKGFSGKNTNRPDFIKMIEYIKSNKITKLIVYRIDRISRSITDFANIIDILEEYKVSFLSSNEKFDTSTPVGKAMLYIIMVFAQLERETIAERIKDNYYSRGKTGVWLGGPAPFGFQLKKDVISGKKITTLEPNKNINLVKKIFDTYANTNSSLGSIAKNLVNKNNEIWNNLKLSRILHNPVYVKADVDIYHFFKFKKCIIVNDVSEFTGKYGCNLYGKRDKGKNKYRNINNQFLAIGHNKGIIDSQTWLLCQKKLDDNIQIKNAGKGTHTWLSGLLKCGYCNYSMVVRKYKNQRYLTCSGKSNYKICTSSTTIKNLDEIEFSIFDQMKNINEGTNKNKIDTKQDYNLKKLNEFKIQLENIEKQINNLINNISNGNEILIKYANKKILQLDEEKNNILEQINKNQIKKSAIKFADLKNWDNLNIDSKKFIAKNFIDKILIYNDKLEVEWKY